VIRLQWGSGKKRAARFPGAAKAGIRLVISRPVLGQFAAHMPQAKLFRDRKGRDEWRVERIDDEGDCEVTIFAGPGAEERARRFADREYGDFEEVEL
jgi:hypothetical protein